MIVEHSHLEKHTDRSQLNSADDKGADQQFESKHGDQMTNMSPITFTNNLVDVANQELVDQNMMISPSLTQQAKTSISPSTEKITKLAIDLGVKQSHLERHTDRSPLTSDKKPDKQLEQQFESKLGEEVLNRFPLAFTNNLVDVSKQELMQKEIASSGQVNTN